MTATREVLDTFTTIDSGVNLDVLAEAIEALLDTERTSGACAAAMLTESDVSDLVTAIHADLDTVAVSQAARMVLTRASGANSGTVRSVVEAAISAAERSNAECGKHAAHHGHCGLCAQSTENTIKACRSLVQGLGG